VHTSALATHMITSIDVDTSRLLGNVLGVGTLLFSLNNTEIPLVQSFDRIRNPDKEKITIISRISAYHDTSQPL